MTGSVNSDSSQLFLLIIKEANMLLKIYEENPNPREVAKVTHTLQDGGLIIYPTDTVYAIGCDALNVRAVEKICQIKGVNPQKSNLSIICYDLSNLSEYAKVNNAAFKLMKKNLPGPFTFILPTSNELPKIYKNRKEVGIRVPDNNIVRTIVQELGNPLLTMSVHDDDDEILEYSTDPELIAEKYDGRVDLVIDGGYGGLEPSTVVDCTTDESEPITDDVSIHVYGLHIKPVNISAIVGCIQRIICYCNLTKQGRSYLMFPNHSPFFRIYAIDNAIRSAKIDYTFI